MADAHCFDDLYFDEKKRRNKCLKESEYFHAFKQPYIHARVKKEPKIPKIPLHLPKIESDKFRDTFGFTYTYRKNDFDDPLGLAKQRKQTFHPSRVIIIMPLGMKSMLNNYTRK